MEHEFKVGDRVRLTTYDYPFSKGAEGVILEIDDEEPAIQLQADNGKKNWVFTRNIEPVSSSHTTPAIKKGDRVRVVDRRPDTSGGKLSWNLRMDKTLGAEGVVIECMAMGNFLHVRFPDGAVWTYKPSWLVPVDSASKPEATTDPFKPGDRVRVKPREWFGKQPKETWRWGNVCIERGSNKELLMGQTVTIERYDARDDTYKADGYWWKAEWLEPVEAEIRPALFRPIELISSATIEALCGMFVSQQPQPSTDKLPLINPNKLLTNIKLD